MILSKPHNNNNNKRAKTAEPVSGRQQGGHVAPCRPGPFGAMVERH